MADNQCTIRETPFSRKSYLYRHLRLKHKKVGIEDPLAAARKNAEQKKTCSVCLCKFPTTVTLKQHIRSHEKSTEVRRSRIICPQDECKESFKNYTSLRNHLTTVHNLNIIKEDLMFESESEFQQWKENYEKCNGTSYVLNTSPNTGNEFVKSYYYCHCSYSYRKTGKNIRKMKSSGSIKLGFACPSTMTVTKNPNMIQVEFWKTHAVACKVGVGHTFLSKTERTQIAAKIQQGVSFQHIIDEVRSSNIKDDGLQRIHLLEKKDLHNITKDFNLTYSTKRHSDDAVSVRLWVAEMRNLGDDSPIVKFKEQGEQGDVDFLNKDDFMLVLMTPFQKRQLEKFGTDKICIDGTHGTNAYDIILYTLVVIDEFGSGCPVAFCFTNRSDQFVFEVFFKYIKKNVGLISAKVFMSDDAPAFYNAWEAVMSAIPHRLLCTWHVDRNWQRNLVKINNSEKKQLVYKTLRVLLQILDIDEFKKSLSNFLNDLRSDTETVAFGEYFVNHYVHRAQVWAYCYRQHLGINTNMYLESVHKTLKYFYLEGKKVKRLDMALCAVMKLARDLLFSRIIKLLKNRCPQRVFRIRQSHNAAKSITKIKILKDDMEWSVTSTENVEHEYCVKKVSEQCTIHDCFLKCSECNICIHIYKCTCLDNVIKFNICKHIHACALLTCQHQSSSNIIPHSSTENEIEHIVRVSGASNASTDDNLITIKAQQLIALSNNSNLDSEQIRLCHKFLDLAIKAINEPQLSFTSKQDVNVTSKIEKQARLFSTKKEKKKRNNLQKPSVRETISISQALDSTSPETLNIHTGFDHSYAQ